MPYTSFAHGDTLVPKHIDKTTFKSSLQNSFFANKFLGPFEQDYLSNRPKNLRGITMETSENAIGQLKWDLLKEAGDSINFAMFPPISVSGGTVDGNKSLEGNETGLTKETFSVQVHELGHAIRDDGPLTRQRSMWNLDEKAKAALGVWHARNHDLWIRSVLSGQAYTKDGVIVKAAATPNRKYCCGNDGGTFKSFSADTDISNTAYFDIACIEHFLAENEASSYPVPPIQIGGEDWWVMLIHSYCRRDLANEGNLKAIQRDIYPRGEKGHPLTSGGSFVGVYNNVIIHSVGNLFTANAGETLDSGDTVSASTNIARNLILGRQSFTMAYAMLPHFESDRFDYNRQNGNAIISIGGIGKPQFSTVGDYGCAVMDCAYNTPAV